MHWITAVFGFVSLYMLGGWLNTFFKSGDSDALWFFGVGFVLVSVLGVLHEMWRRRTQRRDQEETP